MKSKGFLILMTASSLLIPLEIRRGVVKFMSTFTPLSVHSVMDRKYLIFAGSTSLLIIKSTFITSLVTSISDKLIRLLRPSLLRKSGRNTFSENWRPTTPFCYIFGVLIDNGGGTNTFVFTTLLLLSASLFLYLSTNNVYIFLVKAICAAVNYYLLAVFFHLAFETVSLVEAGESKGTGTEVIFDVAAILASI